MARVEAVGTASPLTEQVTKIERVTRKATTKEEFKISELQPRNSVISMPLSEISTKWDKSTKMDPSRVLISLSLEHVDVYLVCELSGIFASSSYLD